MKCIICKNEKCIKFVDLKNYILYYCNTCFHVQSNKPNLKTCNSNKKFNINQTDNPHDLFNTLNKKIYIKCSMITDYYISKNIIPYTYQKSYFSLYSFYYLCNKYNYKIINVVTKDNIIKKDHTYFFELEHMHQDHNSEFYDLLNESFCNNIYSKNTFDQYTLKIYIYKNKLQNLLLYNNLKNYKLVFLYDYTFHSKIIKNILYDICYCNCNYKIHYTNFNKTKFNNNNKYLLINIHNNEVNNLFINFNNITIYNTNLLLN